MSSPTNNVKIELLRVDAVPIDYDYEYNAGDMVIWDATNHVIRPTDVDDMNDEASAAAFLGIAKDTQPVTSLNQNLPVPRMSVILEGLVELLVADNATYYPGDYVGIGPDPQEIVKCAGSSSMAIAIVAPENKFAVVSGASVGITAVAGVTKLLVYLKRQTGGLV